MDKRNKLINLESESCADPGLYKSLHPQESFENARLLTFAAYSESDLDKKVQEEVKHHLEKCSSCQKSFNDFEGDHTPQTEIKFPIAICPSSKILDSYTFDKDSLSTTQIEQIEKHLKECEFCPEELQWLKDLEKPPKRHERFLSNWVQSSMAVAAALVLAISAFLFWQKSTERADEQQLKNLAVIEAPEQIDYSSLLNVSEPLEKDMQPIFERGVSAFRAHKFQEAQILFENIIRKQPQHSASLFLLAHSYYRLKQEQKAFELCSLSENIHPHSLERCLFLVNLALKTGHYDHARLEIATLYHEAPNVPEVKRLHDGIMSILPQRNGGTFRKHLRFY